MNIKIILGIIIATVLFGWGWFTKYQAERITNLISQKTELELKLDEKEQQIEKAKQSNLEANREIKKLREIKLIDTETSAWFNSPIPNSVSVQLQERYGAGN